MKFSNRRGVRHLAVCGALLVAGSVLVVSPARAAGILDAIRTSPTTVAAPAAGPAIVADNSLAPQQYTELGLPAIDKPWTGDDYTQAAKVIQDLFQKDPTHLPRLNSPKSGVVFDRFVSVENIPSTTDNSTPPAQRLIAAGTLLKACVPLFYAYVKKTDSGESYDREALKLGAYLLRAEIVAAVLGDQAIASNPAVDPAASQGVTQIKTSLVQAAQGLLEMMTDHDSIRSAEAVALTVELKELFAKAYPELLPDGKIKMRQQVSDAIDKETDPDIKAALTDLLKTMPEK